MRSNFVTVWRTDPPYLHNLLHVFVSFLSGNNRQKAVNRIDRLLRRTIQVNPVGAPFWPPLPVPFCDMRLERKITRFKISAA